MHQRIVWHQRFQQQRLCLVCIFRGLFCVFTITAVAQESLFRAVWYSSRCAHSRAWMRYSTDTVGWTSTVCVQALWVQQLFHLVLLFRSISRAVPCIPPMCRVAAAQQGVTSVVARGAVLSASGGLAGRNAALATSSTASPIAPSAARPRA